MVEGPTYIKDPDAVIDYVFDWNGPAPKGPWLSTGDSVSSHTITVQSGLTLDSSEEYEDDAIRVWLSGGTAGEEYTVACRVVTAQGRTDERTITVKVRQR